MGKRRKYTDGYKNNSVRLALEKNNISAAAQELGIPKSTLQGWVTRHKKQTKQGNSEK